MLYTVNSVNVVKLIFCSIQYHFIRHVLAKFGILYSSQSSDIGQNPEEAISNFRISGQSFIKTNCHKSGISCDIDMKIVPVTKSDNSNKRTSKKIDGGFMLKKCEVIAIFPN